MTNALADATSPYLRQHAGNPVHWRQWGDAPFAEARERDVPVLLSIGYSSCHWCHVMAHESFEDPAVAQVMNDNFVCIKVDREERPDLDAVYMNATVALTGQGGWPMTCFLTPDDAAPFYAGTYYPPAPRGGMPGFVQLLTAISDTWATRRDDVRTAAASVVEHLQAAAQVLPDGTRPVDAALLDDAVGAILEDEDTVHGGFGGAPKFPPSALLEGLLRHHERTGSAPALQAVRRTADVMARGGIHDQLAGGFARYSVDPGWVVPHFEKMLYDNALLLRVYAHLARRTGSAVAGRVAGDCAEFLLRDLRTPEGGFASALDADTNGVEGATYVWTPDELAAAVGDDDGAWAAKLLGVTESGTFEAGASVLQLRDEPDDPARWAGVRARLLRARDGRPQPGRDDKVVTAWNGMAILALVEAWSWRASVRDSAGAGGDEGPGIGAGDGTRPSEESDAAADVWLTVAEECARLLLGTHKVDGRLRRSSLGGRVGAADAVLEDYAYLASGLLALHCATGAQEWLTEAQELIDTAVDLFADPDSPGSWFDTAADAETLVHRPRDPVDGATPSGASAITDALLTASALADAGSAAGYRTTAEASLTRAGVLLERAPRSAGNWLAVAEAAEHGPVQVAIAHAPGDSGLVALARCLAPGGAVVVGGPRDSTPLLADRPLLRDQATAYVCRHFVCDRPSTSEAELRGLLEASLRGPAGDRGAAHRADSAADRLLFPPPGTEPGQTFI
ncbi:thioredoxin domain-containing protein [Tomitella gaofuii]|uniref:thioredoxin domain-containing protein n=1 Tax=Tomitella gaofuii TaxID=2760083 RepID=UPI0015FA43B4|nr:thioredoxin domain-containing protein [Tomitella gaofuii]